MKIILSLDFCQVPFARSSLNHDDVFILDTEDKIYQFNGANSNIQERAKALEVIQLLKEKYHGGVCDVAIIGKPKSQSTIQRDRIVMYLLCDVGYSLKLTLLMLP